MKQQKQARRSFQVQCRATRLSICHLCILQCDSLKVELQELQVLYDSSQQERAELEEELQRCKAELEKLSGGAQVKTQKVFEFIHSNKM